MNVQELRKHFKVVWYHLHQGNSTPRERRGKPYMTVAHVIDKRYDEIVGEGVSYCSKDDAPNRHTGLSLAVGRAFMDALGMEHKDPRFGAMVKEGRICGTVIAKGYMPRPHQRLKATSGLSLQAQMDVQKFHQANLTVGPETRPVEEFVDGQDSVAVTDPGVQPLETIDLEASFKGEGER